MTNAENEPTSISTPTDNELQSALSVWELQEALGETSSLLGVAIDHINAVTTWGRVLEAHVAELERRLAAMENKE